MAADNKELTGTTDTKERVELLVTMVTSIGSINCYTISDLPSWSVGQKFSRDNEGSSFPSEASVIQAQEIVAVIVS